VLHSAVYATPATVKFLLSRPDISALVNHRDYYHENDQWGIFYYLHVNTMAGTDRRWTLARLDRNRLMFRLATATQEDLGELATIISEGKGDELDQQSSLDLDRAKDGYGSLELDRSALHYAAAEGNIELAAKLLDNGADVNQRDWFGMTPLHHAAKHGDEDIVELLCRRGADLSLLDDTNNTALQVALDNDHRHLQQLLDPLNH